MKIVPFRIVKTARRVFWRQERGLRSMQCPSLLACWKVKEITEMCLKQHDEEGGVYKTWIYRYLARTLLLLFTLM